MAFLRCIVQRCRFPERYSEFVDGNLSVSICVSTQQRVA
jgi:hypothetical protein